MINSVGFAGTGQRYTLAVMNALGGEGGYDDGVATTTHAGAAAAGGPRRRLTDEFTGAVMSLPICENS